MVVGGSGAERATREEGRGEGRWTKDPFLFRVVVGRNVPSGTECSLVGGGGRWRHEVSHASLITAR